MIIKLNEINSVLIINNFDAYIKNKHFIFLAYF